MCFRPNSTTSNDAKGHMLYIVHRDQVGGVEEGRIVGWGGSV